MLSLSVIFHFMIQTPENGHANYEAEAASTLVEKLVAENSELVEKVFCLSIKMVMV